jgi:hypothetical protein
MMKTNDGTDNRRRSVGDEQPTETSAANGRVSRTHTEVRSAICIRWTSCEVNNTSRQEFVTAVYIEQDTKGRRANSFVLSGLLGYMQTSDDQLVELLCHDEFRQTVNAQSNERLCRESDCE